MTACNKKIFPCKGTFSAITLERPVREFAAIHALSTDVALNINLQIRFFSELLGSLPPFLVVVFFYFPSEASTVMNTTLKRADNRVEGCGVRKKKKK